MAAVVCGGVQWVKARLLPCRAPAMHRESARHTSGWWGAALHLPGWYPLPALVASDTRFGVVFLKTVFIRKDVSAPMCQVAVSPLALLRGFPLNPLPHTAPVAAQASLNCAPEPWVTKASPSLRFGVLVAESDHPLVLILLCPFHVHLGKKQV